MIRLCKEADRAALAEYLKDEPYGRMIADAVDTFGVEAPFLIVYIDEAPGGEDADKKISGVYLWLYGTLLLYCKENQVGIDFLEEMMGIEAPQKVAGRKDNVNIVSWLLTDYRLETEVKIPEILDADGEKITCITEEPEHQGEWAVLNRGEA